MKHTLIHICSESQRKTCHAIKIQATFRSNVAHFVPMLATFCIQWCGAIRQTSQTTEDRTAQPLSVVAGSTVTVLCFFQSSFAHRKGQLNMCTKALLEQFLRKLHFSMKNFFFCNFLKIEVFRDIFPISTSRSCSFVLRAAFHVKHSSNIERSRGLLHVKFQQQCSIIQKVMTR